MESYLQGILLIILLFCGIRDWKEHIIPNAYLIRGFSFRILLFIHEVSTSGADALKSFGWKFLFCLAIGGIGILVRKMTKNGVGMGDIKLSMLMFLYLEAEVWLAALIISFILGLLWGMVLLIRGGSGRRIPFAPFLLMGTMTAVFFTCAAGGFLLK